MLMKKVSYLGYILMLGILLVQEDRDLNDQMKTSVSVFLHGHH